MLIICLTVVTFYKTISKKKYKAQKSHNSVVFAGEPTHMCDTCGKKFFSTNRLNIHMKMTHMKLRPHVCEFCNKGFSSKFALRTHRRQHTNETPYRCEVCGEGFRQNVSLKGHKKSKHNIEEPKICECKECGKGFASEWALKTHQRLH
jgi:KRAB domain-containing zinc finger protein